jgi:hypothetical protein
MSVLSTLTAITLTLVVIWLSVTAIIIALGSKRRKHQRHTGVLDRYTEDERLGEIHWAVIRLAATGFEGDSLQEELCRAVNCSPAEARTAIDLANEEPLSGPPG